MNIGEFILGTTLLGRGSFSQVKLGQELTTGETVAVKIIDKTHLSPHEKDCVGTEINVLQRLAHPYLVRYLDHFSDPDQTFIVLEYVPGGNLFSFVKNHGGTLSERHAQRIIKQCLEGIGHCHALNISHRDLKLEHILLDASMNVKIIDFGLACQSPPDVQVTTYCGSLLYSSPEVLLQKPYFPQRVDIWALGVILFVILCGYFPFFSDDKNSLVRRITAGIISFPREKPGVTPPSPLAQDIILRMLSMEPTERPSCNTLLASPWFAIPIHNHSSGEDLLDDDSSDLDSDF